jgi:hypothetical protein
LEWLLAHSVGNSELLRWLEDCPDSWDAKLDARILRATYEQIGAASARLGISVSVYVRKLLYHFYVTKHLKYVGSGRRYTLANHHDQT